MRRRNHRRTNRRYKRRRKSWVFLALFFFVAFLFLKYPEDDVPQKITQLETIRDQITSEIENLGNDNRGENDQGKDNYELAEIDESNCLYYYFTNLTEEERILYTKILNGINQLDTSIKIEADQEQMERIIHMIMADHPEIFWTEGSYQCMIYGSYIVLQPVYNCDASVKQQREQEIERETVQALEQIQTGTSQYKYVKNTFTYLIDTVDYVADAPDNQNIYSALVNKQTVCAGYSKATQYLLQRMGMVALYVTGNVVDRGDHAWNIVQCDGEYYQVDTTFGDPNFLEYDAEQLETLPSEFMHDYYYLCCNDEMMYRDRSVDTELAVPVCSSGKYNYYEMNNAYFESYSQEVVDNLTNSILNGNRYWFCRFSNYEAYSAMFAEIQNGLYSRLVMENSSWEVQSVRTYFSYRDETCVIKLWY